jgi:Xaa-Pro aminopeptidase
MVGTIALSRPLECVTLSGPNRAKAESPLQTEFETKRARLVDYMDRRGLDGVLLQQRANFAWITCGGDNHVANDNAVGVAAVLVGRQGNVVCLTDSIEAARVRDEELATLDIPVVSFPWFDGKAREALLAEHVGGRRIATDAAALGAGLPSLAGDFPEIRWSLTEAEVQRYHVCGRHVADALESAARQVHPGHSEHAVAAMVSAEVQRRGCTPRVVLVAADDRGDACRHPIPTARRIERQVVLIACGAFGGLVSSVTRTVHFGRLPDEARRRHVAAATVHAAAIDATRVGRRLGDVFGDIVATYDWAGFPHEWTKHHQGGSAGYAARDVVATAASNESVEVNQAFAWNPTVAGHKCEETLLVGAGPPLVLTAPNSSWPTLAVRLRPNVVFDEADILVATG